MAFPGLLSLKMELLGVSLSHTPSSIVSHCRALLPMWYADNQSDFINYLET